MSMYLSFRLIILVSMISFLSLSMAYIGVASLYILQRSIGKSVVLDIGYVYVATLPANAIDVEGSVSTYMSPLFPSLGESDLRAVEEVDHVREAYLIIKRSCHGILGAWMRLRGITGQLR